MIRRQSVRLFALTAVVALMLNSQTLQASSNVAIATMTSTAAVGHADPTNALVYVYVEDSVAIRFGGADIHEKEFEQPCPGKRIFNLRHLPPHQFRPALVYATYTYHSTAGPPWQVTVKREVTVQAGKIEEVHFTKAEFDRARLVSRIASPPCVLYTFREGAGRMVFDESKSGPPLDLYIHDESKTRWSNHHGLQIKGPVRIASVRPAKELVHTLQRQDAITIEAWITPENIKQEGPARIVSLSDNTDVRNFTLGQIKDGYDLRLRATQLEGKNKDNGLPSVTTRPGAVSTCLTHVVYTRCKTGEARIYVNGERKDGGWVAGDFSNWKDDFHLLLGNETSLDRTWRGTYHLVAIYDRALTPDEVKQNHRAGS